VDPTRHPQRDRRPRQRQPLHLHRRRPHQQHRPWGQSSAQLASASSFVYLLPLAAATTAIRSRRPQGLEASVLAPRTTRTVALLPLVSGPGMSAVLVQIASYNTSGDVSLGVGIPSTETVDCSSYNLRHSQLLSEGRYRCIVPADPESCTDPRHRPRESHEGGRSRRL